MSDPATSEDFAACPQVRALLAAGVAEEVDYDFAKGLQLHLAAVGVAPVLPHGGPAAEMSKVAASISAKAVASAIALPVVVASLIAGLGFAARAHVPVGRVRTPPSIFMALPAKPTPPLASHSAGIEASRTTSVSPVPAIELEAPEIVPVEPRAAAKSRSTVTSVAYEASPPKPVPAEETTAAQGTSPATITEPPPGSTSAVTSHAAGNSVGSVRTPAVAKPSEPARAPDDELAREMADLVEAKRALSSDPRRALELSERGQREFPHGLFHEERVHILLLALIELGRVDDARRLAAPYLREHPDSPFAQRVQNALDSAAHATRP